MQIEFDEAKRQKTLAERALDFADASKVFTNAYFEFVDNRMDYGEVRFLTFGELDGRHVVITWTYRGHSRRIISMRYAHDEEIAARRRALD